MRKTEDLFAGPSAIQRLVDRSRPAGLAVIAAFERIGVGYQTDPKGIWLQQLIAKLVETEFLHADVPHSRIGGAAMTSLAGLIGAIYRLRRSGPRWAATGKLA